ncbi:HD domain-containing phosphohydrolase [Sporanaerobium hydrogeniformans]|uniref:HD domain-containing phosphohydrolase n=1 Tax=Sporanaerobium hydrogeniformans TaxID=3072179 RepID=UPI0015D49CA6|nr:HD domain-containing phosphohydrolase [Sporanaerobium hydrogeniformans]
MNFVERDYRYMKKIPDDLLTTKDLVDDTFKMINENPNCFYNLYIACNGKVVGTRDERYINSNPIGREWYDLAISRGDLVITNPYEDIITKEKVITISKKIKDTNNCVVGLDIKQSEINSILNQMVREEESIAAGFILNREGVFVGHTNEIFIGKTIFDQSIDKQELIAPYIEDLLMKESGKIDFDNIGFPYSLIYHETKSEWHVVYVVDKAVMSTATNEYSKRLMITYILCVVLLNIVILVYYTKRQKAIRLQKRAEHAEKELRKYKEDLEVMVETKTEKIKIQSEKLKTLNIAIIDNLADIVEFRDLESGQHIKRIKRFTYILAKKVTELYPEYKIDEEKIDLLCNASALHDIGKIGISDSILLKPGKLTKEEFEEMKTHTIIGDNLVLRILENYDKYLAKIGHEICRYHHERFDGRGYPDGLKGDAIPICAQIVGIVDVYDALIEKRVYKEAFSHERAIQMINDGECGIFSPKLLHCLNLVEDEFYNISKMYE